MKTHVAYYRILRMIAARQIDALVAGRYQPPYSPSAYWRRDKSKAFRCIAYQDAIRDVSALMEAATLMKMEVYREKEKP